MHPLHHAESSARKWGGLPEDYLRLHEWFDASKAMMADLRHRALRHHAEGIFMCEHIYGVSLINSAGREVPVRWIGEQHVREDLGWIPSVQDWFKHIRPEKWMRRGGKLDEPEATSDATVSTQPKLGEPDAACDRVIVPR